MTTPAAAAADIIAWLGSRSLAQMRAAFPADAPRLHALADLIADAADSDDEAVRGAGLGALFGGLVEPLNDGFTPAGRELYHLLFGHIVWRVASRDARLRDGLAGFGIAGAAGLLARHAALRSATAPLPADPRTILVLSRVTIGADVLLGSVALQRLHQRYPQARLVLVGDGKLQGLLGGLPQVAVRPLSYARRGPLRERLASWLQLVAALDELKPDLVVNPDSRLDQLGLLPVTRDPAATLLWENTRPEGTAPVSLATLLDRFLAQRLGLPAMPEVVPRVALDAPTRSVAGQLAAAFGSAPIAAVKLDHGGNPAKSLPRAGEVVLLKRLRSLGWRILLDRGFGPDELRGSDELLTALGWTAIDIDDSGKGLGLQVADLAPHALADAQVIRFHGSIAGWAAALAACRQALAYDSVGHHLAAALGVPLVTAFTGHADDGFPVAWAPRGPGRIQVIAIPTADKADPSQWERVAGSLQPA